MGNIVSYVKWRGDIGFKERIFNDVDNLILSFLSYYDFKNIIPDITYDKKITLEDCISMYLSKPRPIKAVLPNEDKTFLPLLAASERFKNGKVSKYIDITQNKKRKIQFSAFTIEYDDFIFISFRGTDETIVGWREDFKMSYEIVSAQIEAAKYLEKVINKNSTKPYYVGGHSKGGNLAIYSSMVIDDERKKVIKRIYSNDGPGIYPELKDEKEYKKIEKKITKIVPEFSIIGMLNEEENVDFKIVQSNAKTLMQHDLLTWQIDKDSLAIKSKLLPGAISCNKIIDEWIEDVDMESRRKFIDSFFNALEINGAQSISDLSSDGIFGFEKILKSMISGEKKSKELFYKLLRVIFYKLLNTELVNTIKTNATFQGIVYFFFGLSLIALPSLIVYILGRIFFALTIFYTLYKLFRLIESEKSNETYRKYLKYWYYALIAIEILCFIFKQTVFFSVYTILGVIFFIITYRSYNLALKLNEEHNKKWIFYLFNSLISLYIGVLSFALYNYDSTINVVISGLYFTALGVYKIIKRNFFNKDSEIK